MAERSTGKLLAEGLTDAVGFFIGGLVGFAIGRVAGFDIFPTATEGPSIVGLVLCGLGGGAGVQLARKWRARTEKR